MGKLTETEIIAMREEREKLEHEKQELELIVLRQQVADMKAKTLQKAKSHSDVERDLAQFRAVQSGSQKNCNHRKGGTDLDAIQGKGNDAQYAVWKMQLGNGKRFIICSRCQKEWLEGRDAGFATAWEWPTTNSPSASMILQVTKNPEAAVAE